MINIRLVLSPSTIRYTRSNNISLSLQSDLSSMNKHKNISQSVTLITLVLGCLFHMYVNLKLPKFFLKKHKLGIEHALCYDLFTKKKPL